MKKNVMVVFGTRPEAIKMVPVIKELERFPDDINPVIVSTGQHGQMLTQVLSIFSIRPHYELNIMTRNQSLSDICARVLSLLGPVIETEDIDLLLVQGDTTTAFAAALSGFFHKRSVAHIEAGLRTHDKFNPFPEEMNRKLISSLSDINFAPTDAAKQNLQREGIGPESIYVTGNTVIDTLLSIVSGHKQDTRPKETKTILVTAHRRENWGKPMADICQAVLEIVHRFLEVNVVFPVHLNPAVRETVNERLAGHDRISLLPPMDYIEIAKQMAASYLILTDSGGIQEEAPSLGVPVLVLRNETERMEGVLAGTAKLVGTSTSNIVQEAVRLLEDDQAYTSMSKAHNPYGDGKASQRIVQYIRDVWVNQNGAQPQSLRRQS